MASGSAHIQKHSAVQLKLHSAGYSRCWPDHRWQLPAATSAADGPVSEAGAVVMPPLQVLSSSASLLLMLLPAGNTKAYTLHQREAKRLIDVIMQMLLYSSNTVAASDTC